ncbi:hypothetical protein ACJX0J_002144 [Zea mays]
MRQEIIKSTFGILLPSFGSRLSRWHWDLFGVTQVQKKEFLHFNLCLLLAKNPTSTIGSRVFCAFSMLQLPEGSYTRSNGTWGSKQDTNSYTICYINRVASYVHYLDRGMEILLFSQKPLPKLFRRKPNWLLPITAFPIDIGTFVPEQ